ncbi:leucine-rich repeat domain-containing protein [Eubacterium sp.]
MNKIISLLMAFVMLLSVASGLTLTVYAGTPTSGQYGTNVYWKYDEESNELTIFGTGAMSNYSSPWEKYKNNILTVTIEDGITSISRSAFSNCSSLKTITIPNSVTYINDSAFSNCSSLIDVTIPEGVTSIGTSAFSNCSSLKTITIPSSVTYIGSDAFYDCDSLETVYFEGYKAKWKKIQINKKGNDSILKANVICKELKDNCNGTCNENISWEYNPSTKTMTFSGNGDLNLSDPVFENTPSPFTWRDVVEDDEIENVVVSDSITYVDFVSFDYFKNIKSIELGKDVKKINISNHVYYYGFKFLKNINVSSENLYMISIDGVVYNKIKQCCFVIHVARRSRNIKY